MISRYLCLAVFGALFLSVAVPLMVVGWPYRWVRSVAGKMGIQ